MYMKPPWVIFLCRKGASPCSLLEFPSRATCEAFLLLLSGAAREQRKLTARTLQEHSRNLQAVPDTGPGPFVAYVVCLTRA